MTARVPALMKEEEIRPEEIFDEYLRLAEQDAGTYFSAEERYSIHCPACGNDGEYCFSKASFDYQLCCQCLTLFVSPRPSTDCFQRYYQESASARYWATTFYKHTAEARREKLWRPKAQLIKELIQRFAVPESRVLDIGGGYGIFAEEFQRLSDAEVIVIEPGPALANICREKGLTVLEDFLEKIEKSNLPSGHKTFVSFELFEHVPDLGHFMASLYELLSSGDLFIFTTLSGTGVDIQVLWEHSKSVSPPHHLNFLNPKSVGLLLNRTGFEVLKVETPGKLDIDILCNNRRHIKDRFWRTFIDQADEDDKYAMQSFIANRRLSSHMLVVSRKL